MHHEDFISLIKTHFAIVNPSGTNISGRRAELDIAFGKPGPWCLLLMYEEQGNVSTLNSSYPTELYFLVQDDTGSSDVQMDALISDREKVAKSFLTNLYNSSSISFEGFTINDVRKDFDQTATGVRVRLNILAKDSTGLVGCDGYISPSVESVIAAFNQLSTEDKVGVQSIVCA